MFGDASSFSWIICLRIYVYILMQMSMKRNVNAVELDNGINRLSIVWE